MTILITGISGFIGQSLLPQMRDTHQIYALTRNSKPTPKPIRILPWSANTLVPAEVETVIHLAGKAHDVKGKSQASDYFRINTDLTKRLFDSFLSSPAQRFIFFSSVKAVADTTGSSPLTEQINANPIGPYGESKWAAEEYIRSREPEYTSQGKEVFILRPAMVHGPGNRGNLNLLYQVVKFGFPWPLGAYTNNRTLCSIDNLLFTVREILAGNIAPGTYNVADDSPMSTMAIVELMGEIMGRSTRIWRIPKWAVQLIAKSGDILPLPLNSTRLAKLTEDYEVSNQKLREALGIAALPTSAVDGMRKTIKWLVENNRTIGHDSISVS